MRPTKIRTAKVLMMVAALSGGSLFSASCLGRVRLAAVDGSRSFFFDMLNQASAALLSNLATTEN